MARTARKSINFVEPKKTAKRVFYWSKYLRKSSEEDDSRSIHNQDSVLDGVMERIIELDTENEYVFVDVYHDEDYTGTDSERPDFKRLLRDLGSGKVNMVLVTDLSRLSRNIAESINYVQGMFVVLDIRFISTQLPALDSFLEPDRVYSLEVPMQSMMNENHCAETSFKVRRTFNRLREQGQFIGAFAAYGWRKDPDDRHKLLLDEEPAQVMQQMKAWIIDGSNAPTVARMLNKRGIPNPTGYKASKGMKYSPSCKNPSHLWSARTVRYVMTRPENTGKLIQGRYKVKSYKIHTQIKTPEDEWFIKDGAIPAIFTEEEMKLILDCLNRDTRVSPDNKAKEVYLFSGFLKCPDCGKAMVRKNSGNYVYYICNTFKNYGKAGCTKHSIRHEKLEAAVLAAIQQQIAIAVSLQDVIDRLDKAPLVSRQNENYDTMIKTRQREIQKIANFKRSLYEDWKNGDITQAEYRSMKFEYTEQEENLQRIVETLQEEKRKVLQATDRENPFITHFVKHRNIKALTRDILIELVDNILVHESGDITIRFRFGDEYQRIVDCLEDSKQLLA